MVPRPTRKGCTAPHFPRNLFLAVPCAFQAGPGRVFRIGESKRGLRAPGDLRRLRKPSWTILRKTTRRNGFRPNSHSPRGRTVPPPHPSLLSRVSRLSWSELPDLGLSGRTGSCELAGAKSANDIPANPRRQPPGRAPLCSATPRDSPSFCHRTLCLSYICRANATPNVACGNRRSADGIG